MGRGCACATCIVIPCVDVHRDSMCGFHVWIVAGGGSASRGGSHSSSIVTESGVTLGIVAAQWGLGLTYSTAACVYSNSMQ